MDNKEHLTSNCKTMSNAAPEAQMSTQTFKIEIKEEIPEECRDEKESPCSDYMCPPELVEPPEYVNYYDGNINVLKKLKKEIPEDECRQSECSMNSKIVFENTELLPLIKKQKVIIENMEEEFLLNVNNADGIRNNQITIKTERLEEQDIKNNSGATSVYYDVLVTGQEVKCKLCGRIFQNNFSLLKHNDEHVKTEIKAPGDSEINELHQCQYCDKRFDNYNNMLIHITDVHSENNAKCEICGERFNSVPNLERHVKLLHKHKNLPNQVTPNDMKCIHCNLDFKHKYRLNNHMKLCRPGKGDKGKTHKCDSCQRVYKSKGALVSHIKKAHFEYGKMFECSCGKQFPSPIHLTEHKSLRHCTSSKNELYKCKCCESAYNLKSSLTRHMKRVHYDEGKTFECRCGKQFPSPIHLAEHKTLRHCTSRKNVFYKCNHCEAVYNVKTSLTKHIKRMHYDYGRSFDCWCGKQFRTPQCLREHMRRQHDGKMKNINDKVQCDYCQKKFKTKHYLLTHIKSVHYDYGKLFDCWCGKQFRTPKQLREHKRWQHDGNTNNTNSDKLYSLNNHNMKLCHTGKEDEEKEFKCDLCEGVYKSKHCLKLHKKRMHYDYGTMFSCWCGKQFRSPIQLSQHKWHQHAGKIINKVQCDTCQKMFKSKALLLKHNKNVHYDYGKIFECWCGKLFRTPKLLFQHKRRHRDSNINDTNNDKPQTVSCSVTS